jgi:hypothetical protein
MRFHECLYARTVVPLAIGCTILTACDDPNDPSTIVLDIDCGTKVHQGRGVGSSALAGNQTVIVEDYSSNNLVTRRFNLSVNGSDVIIHGADGDEIINSGDYLYTGDDVPGQKQANVMIYSQSNVTYAMTGCGEWMQPLS